MSKRKNNRMRHSEYGYTDAQWEYVDRKLDKELEQERKYKKKRLSKKDRRFNLEKNKISKDNA